MDCIRLLRPVHAAYIASLIAVYVLRPDVFRFEWAGLGLSYLGYFGLMVMYFRLVSKFKIKIQKSKPPATPVKNPYLVMFVFMPLTGGMEDALYVGAIFLIKPEFQLYALVASALLFAWAHKSAEHRDWAAKLHKVLMVFMGFWVAGRYGLLSTMVAHALNNAGMMCLAVFQAAVIRGQEKKGGAT